jgi:hypothetical protein
MTCNVAIAPANTVSCAIYIHGVFTLVYISELGNLPVSLVREIEHDAVLGVVELLNLRLGHARLATAILPDKIEAEQDAQRETNGETGNETQEPRVVDWRLRLQEELGPDDVAGAVGNKGLQLVVELAGDSTPSTRSGKHTMALTVVFLVKPPKLLDMRDRIRGKLEA